MGRGFLRLLDPRGKLVCLFGFTLAVSISRFPEAPLLGLCLGLVLAIDSGLGFNKLILGAVGVNFFALFLWMLLPWSLEWQGGPVFNFNPAGLSLAGLITLKVNAVYLATASLLATSRVNDVLHALAHFKLPGKLVALFMLFHRYLNLLRGEYRRMRRAMAVRCFVPGSNLHTYRSMAQLFGMLLVRSYDRSERIHWAMLCRGFNGTFWVLDHFHWHRRDWLFCVAGSMVVALLLFLGLEGGIWL